MDDLVRGMDLEGVSKSRVSRLCAEIDERVRYVPRRPFEGHWSVYRSALNPAGRDLRQGSRGRAHRTNDGDRRGRGGRRHPSQGSPNGGRQV
uniref:hypothetical protein n=1 Tax=Pararoseomonas baculiformis TaxID=2820812 RepID=UPI003158A0F2